MKSWTMWICGGVALSAVLGMTPYTSALGVGLGQVRPALPPTTGKGASIDEKTLESRRAVTCVGSQKLVLDRVLINVPDGIAVSATGCGIRITNSRIVGQIALQLAGGSMTIENSIIEGPLAFQMSGGSVAIKSSTVKGGVQNAGGTLDDQGNNLWPTTK